MPIRYFFIVVVLALGGCVTFNESEIAQFHRLGVPPPLLAKLERRQPLLVDDVIASRRLHVPDPMIIRHLNSVGVDYVVTRADVSQLRKADVQPAVIVALVDASERFAARRLDTTYYDPWIYDDPWFWPGVYGGWSLDYHSGSWHGGHGHHH